MGWGSIFLFFCMEDEAGSIDCCNNVVNLFEVKFISLAIADFVWFLLMVVDEVVEELSVDVDEAVADEEEEEVMRTCWLE